GTGAAGTRSTLRRCRLALTAAVRAAIGTLAAQHEQARRERADLRDGAGLAVLRVLLVLDRALHVDRGALLQVLLGDVRQLAPRLHAMPLRALLLLTAPVRVLAARRDRQRGDLRLSCHPDLGVVAEIADDHCLVQGTGH